MHPKLLLPAVMLCASAPGFAAYTLTITQSGADVVATGSGSVDTRGLPSTVGTSQLAVTSPGSAQIYIGGDASGPAAALTTYGPVTGPTAFGTTYFKVANAATGTRLGVAGGGGRVALPINYVSGSALGTSTATWTATTLAALGLTEGTYVYTWGSGANADKFTVVIQTAPAPVATSVQPVPTLSAWAIALLSATLATSAMILWRRNR